MCSVRERSRCWAGWDAAVTPLGPTARTAPASPGLCAAGGGIIWYQPRPWPGVWQDLAEKPELGAKVHLLGGQGEQGASGLKGRQEGEGCEASVWGDHQQFRVCGGFCCPAEGWSAGRGRAGPCIPCFRFQGPLPEPEENLGAS